MLDQAERVQRILGGVSKLGSESVDEATGHPLDNLINAQGDEWRQKLRQQFLAYRAAANSNLGRANALVEQYQHLREDDLVSLRSAEIAVETALLALSGQEPEPGGSEHSRRPPKPGWWRTPKGRAEAADPGAEAAPSPDPGHADRPGRRAAVAALEPSKVSRSELRRLLDPQDAGRVPRWGDPGFRDGTLLAGRPRSAYLHAFALLLAAGADVGAFVQIVELVLPVQEWVIWIVVSGLTSVVLYIAHMVGVMIREAKAGHSSGGGLVSRLGAWLGRRSAAFICTVIWLAVGLMAFWVRLTVPLPGTVQVGGGIGSGGIGSGGIGSGGTGSGGTSGIGTTNAHALQGAAIFLGLYLATGVVAAVGAYFTHNPYRGRYAAAIRAHRKASERAAASAYQLGTALAGRERQQAEMDSAARILAEAEVQNSAFTQQLKQSVRIEIAALSKDPAVTDALFEADQRPYRPAPDGPPPDREEPGVPTP